MKLLCFFFHPISSIYIQQRQSMNIEDSNVLNKSFHAKHMNKMKCMCLNFVAFTGQHNFSLFSPWIFQTNVNIFIYPRNISKAKNQLAYILTNAPSPAKFVGYEENVFPLSVLNQGRVLKINSKQVFVDKVLILLSLDFLSLFNQNYLFVQIKS